MQLESTELKKGASLGNTIVNMCLKHKSAFTKAFSQTAMGEGMAEGRKQSCWRRPDADLRRESRLTLSL